MIPNIDSRPTMKPFEDVSGIFATVNFDVNFDGKYLTWIKIPRVFDAGTNMSYNAYCFETNSLDCFDDSYCVVDPTNVNMKVEF